MRASSLIDRSVSCTTFHAKVANDYVGPHGGIRMIMRPVVHLRTTVVRLVETSISCATPYEGRGQSFLNVEHVLKSAATCLRSISLARRQPATSAIDIEILLRSPTIPPQFRSQPGRNAYICHPLEGQIRLT